ncbi:NUDIX hydrolase [Palleronia caenipelagi]|uniref:NUDIX hydrolase n=1 Tax=Palleronia caenipelagi TaxID=2489174 RepID=A0A547QAE0_9RHOB|nr:NUDIX hydrolase [Palleronia caenipelagi]TRD23334.1 NUDIX hydrolase [Palleronia caenipelagi]
MGQEDARVLSDVPIRDAATVIVVRDAATHPRLLMGQRGRSAVFMPDKYVFPGGAVDPGDTHVQLSHPLNPVCRRRLERPGAPPAHALAVAAIRELWEETGQVLGRSGVWPDPPADWAGFAATGHVPDASGLSYVFRAITPPGRPRRFDARFFLLDAAALVSDPDDFSGACEELSHLHWVGLDDARHLDLPFITSVVLGELHAHLPRLGQPDRVPFFRNDDLSTVADEASLPEE